MTICIAALCDGGKACVVGADKQVTAPGLSLEFQHPGGKIESTGKSCVAMASGDALLASEITIKTRGQFSHSASPSVQQFAEKLRDTFKTIHLERAESVILHPRGLTLKEFKEKGSQQLPAQIYLAVDQLLFNFGLNVVEFIVAGVDSTGAHIFRVYYQGVAGANWLEWCDRLGYRAIGTGGLHASIFLALAGQHNGMTVADTIYNVYAAKKTAEVAPGVGPATDLAVVSASGVTIVEGERIAKLEDLRAKRQQTIGAPPEWREIYDDKQPKS